LSDDSDLAQLKAITTERAAKQQVQIDLDNIAEHGLLGEKNGVERFKADKERVEVQKKIKPDNLKPETVA